MSRLRVGKKRGEKERAQREKESSRRTSASKADSPSPRKKKAVANSSKPTPRPDFPLKTAYFNDAKHAHDKKKLTSFSLVVRERRPTDDEDALPAEHSMFVESLLVVVVVSRGRSREVRIPLGDSAPVSLLGLIRTGALSNVHDRGTTRRGSEPNPRGEPEDRGAPLVFMLAFFFGPQRERLPEA